MLEQLVEGGGSVRRALTAGWKLAPDTNPDQHAFELGAILAVTNTAAVLHDDNTSIDRARQAVRARLRT